MIWGQGGVKGHGMQRGGGGIIKVTECSWGLESEDLSQIGPENLNLN